MISAAKDEYGSCIIPDLRLHHEGVANQTSPVCGTKKKTLCSQSDHHFFLAITEIGQLHVWLEEFNFYNY